MPPAIMWFRRDLRLADNPALCAALAEADGADTYPVFVLDPALLGPAGAARKAFLRGCLDALDDSLDGRLTIAAGDPAEVIPRLRAVHQPWKLDGGPPQGYPDRIVDHAAERQVTLARYADTRGGH